MRNLLKVGLLVGALAILAAVSVFVWGAPRVLEVLPADGSEGVPARAQVKITFSQPLDSAATEARLSFDPPIEGAYTWEGSQLIFTPEQAWLAGGTVRVRLEAGAPARSFPWLRLREEGAWSFSIRLPQILYLFPAVGSANLYRYDPVRAQSAPLTGFEAGVLDFTVDGAGQAVYLSVRRGAEGSVIYRMDLSTEVVTSDNTGKGSGSQAAADFQVVYECEQAICSELALEPAGRYLAYERRALPGGAGSQAPQVWVLPLQPADGEPAFLAGLADHQTILPAWSSRGVLAVYDRDASAYLFSEPGKGVQARFPNRTGEQGAWRPDGEAFLAPEIIYLGANISPELSGLESLADSHLILFFLHSEKTQDLTPGEGIEDTAPAYSKDGNFLAFARKYLDVQNWTPGRQLWIAQAVSREARQMTDVAVYNHFDFAWNPASDQLVYVRFDQSALSQPPEIWLLDLASNQSTSLIQGGFSPQWAP
ncbi:MAG: hypothetical protein B6D39_07445 [Anaerolineae bacterium UTCFX2]|jgi:Tol biopolymer transport system component|nr:Ig-like domain-containing protein [Anaerolineales bacterium]OQY90983.1 MAG: hypothetical protein B6D39_07445 [Anaerolineae bacterium UTCFX2]